MSMIFRFLVDKIVLYEFLERKIKGYPSILEVLVVRTVFSSEKTAIKEGTIPRYLTM